MSRNKERGGKAEGKARALSFPVEEGVGQIRPGETCEGPLLTPFSGKANKEGPQLDR